MRIADLPAPALVQRLRGPGLLLGAGPFVYRLRSPHALVAEGLALLYADMPLVADDRFADFCVEIAPGQGLHRWFRRQSHFCYDGLSVFEPLPEAHAYALLEWAMNWCISSQPHDYLVIHSAVVARGDRAVILPAPPGSGKSTLCAALIHSGWRLLSDELALVSLADGRLWPLCRPVGLKNASIKIIQDFAPAAVINRVTHDTNKGDVSHMKVPAEHLAQMAVPARPKWLIFPRWQRDAATNFSARSRASAVVDLARHSFNFGTLGEAGFDALCDVVNACECMDFSYSRLDEAMVAFDRLDAAA